MRKQEFAKYYANLISGPSDPGREFILSGITYGKIYRLAAGINKLISDKAGEFVCLCTDNKAVIAAAILASLQGGPSILLPHAFNKRAINELKYSENFDLIITDIPDEIPSNLVVVTPEQIREADSFPEAPRDPDSGFLKIFTGGSTGKPKTWHKTPRNLISEALYHSKSFNITKDDIFVSSVPPQHIYGLLYSILIPFVSSAKTAEKIPYLPQEIISSVINNSATALVSIPMHYRVLKGRDFNFSSLRLALSSGGSLDYADAKYFYDRTGLEISEIFGSTETGGIAIRNNSGKEIPWSPFNSVDWKIRKGHLAVRSDFISPDLPKDTEDFYTTEDLVKSDEQNTFINLGRADNVIKVGGKRVDLKEVESALKQLPGVDDAVVVSVPAPGGRKNDIAAIVKGNMDSKGVRQAALRLLESHAVPRKIIIVDEIPVLSTGKYDGQKILEILKKMKNAK